jgi:hypothetical protein
MSSISGASAASASMALSGLVVHRLPRAEANFLTVLGGLPLIKKGFKKI